MRTVLTNLPWKRDACFGVRAGSRWPFMSLAEKNGYINYIPFPFFLAYATALLKSKGKEARLIDAIAENIREEGYLAELTLDKPDLLIAEVSTPSFDQDIRMLKRIRSLLPHCQIALCGSHAGVFFKQILEEHADVDFVLRGEYELTALELAVCLEHKGSLDAVKGLAWRKGKDVRINSPRPTLEDLDLLPWPERTDVPVYKYNDEFCGLPTPNVQLWSSRGCPFQCTFCLWPQAVYGDNRYRMREPAQVLEEMEWLINNYSFKAVYFDDDVFNIDREHVLAICKGIKAMRRKVPWAAMARADLMDEELLKVMQESGLYALKYGIESGSQRILDSCNKKLDLGIAAKTIALTRKHGIKVHLSFCLGLLGENRQTVAETAGFIRKSQPDSYQISFATPFPGTAYFAYLKDKGYLVSENWPDYDGNLKCVARTEELSNTDLAGIKNDLRNNLNL